MSNESYVFAGLGGETAPDREVHTGLYRIAEGREEWEALSNGLPEAPEIRALTVHPSSVSYTHLRYHETRRDLV